MLLAAVSAADGLATSSKGYDDLVEWVRHNGGRVDDRLGIGTHVHNGEGFRGGVAKGDIEAGTELLFCPWTLIFGTQGDTATVPADHCAILRAYAAQVEAGEGSFWYPYLSMDTSLATRIPSVWHRSVLDELQGLPPAADATESSLTDWFSQTCAGGKPFAELEGPMQQSLLAAVTRSAGMRFLPIFDLLNHHNGKLNTKSHADIHGNTVTATKDILKGEEIFNSYRGGRTTSSDIFRRYGFVEPWPQQWAWTDRLTSNEIRFLLLPDGSVAISPPDSMSSRIGQESPELCDLRAEVDNHNMELSVEQLARFDHAGRSLLISIPTTVEEDVAVLSDLTHKLSLNANKVGEDALQVQDRMSAVTYRMQFKKAVEISLGVSSALLRERNGGGEL